MKKIILASVAMLAALGSANATTATQRPRSEAHGSDP